MTRKKQPPAPTKEIIHLYDEGKTAPEIADSVGLSESRIHNLLRENNKTRRDRGGKQAIRQREEDRKKAIAWGKDGVAEREVARRLGRTRSYVKVLLAEAGGVPRPLASERDQKIARLFVEEGKTQVEIGEQFGISNTRVSQILRRAGYTKEDQAKAAPDWVSDKELSRLYLDEGLSLRETASRVGMSKSGVRTRLEVAGVPLRPASSTRTHPKKKKEMEDRNRRMVEAFRAGKSISEIAEQYELSYARTRRIIAAGRSEE